MELMWASVFVAVVSPGAAEATAPPAVPEWVVSADRAVLEGHDRVLYAVSGGVPVRNIALARTTADNRARNALSLLFIDFQSDLVRRHLAGVAEQELVLLGMIVKGYPAAQLDRVEIAERWTAPNGAVYSLARLVLEADARSYTKLANDSRLPGDGLPFFIAAFDAMASRPQPALPTDGRCAAYVRIYPGKSEGPSCDLDPRLIGGLGVVAYPCAGGAAEARFGDAVLRGDVTNGAVKLASATGPDESISCRRAHAVRISGKLADGVLALVDEQPGATGVVGECSQACTAQAEVRLRLEIRQPATPRPP